ncbi:hypothetical protein GLOIN_2v1767453 [Rhizophagus irregularis DAOM 181602=DAOM 197198]|nr:hypothetical protein GLOIN_2v1767453 [Rhizophagus irregularis DAOM 181602=DAOM 197198]POG77884.1 hypothetical protein GLOIN_2v1767453 [Rhizophagus irregularis DAOM 181602=DAOM 197198]|eukprot:XP_025184750.1 hypothetical protein GLOIN_2v1767453 [Rhizophagus irregularis DAOM 181602=DAOM 197198]
MNLLPKYDGTIHPDEWLRQIKTQCMIHINNNHYYSNLENMTLEVAKSLVDPSINVNNVRSNDQLLTTLKNNVLFKIFLKSSKQKLRDLSYKFNTCGDEAESTLEFLVKFKKLCDNAEIINIDDQKFYLIHTLDIIYQYKFSEKIININTFDELLTSFQDFIIDQKCSIRSSSIVIIKHVATGKYLSSNNCPNGRYGYVVTLSNNQSDPSCQWQIIGQSLNDEIHYGNKIRLKSPATNQYLSSTNGCKSPATNHHLVYSYGSIFNWIVQFGNSVDYNGMWKLNDKFSLLCEIGSAKSLLRAHDFHFNIGNKNFQEVVCHNERFGGNDEWCIEFF